MISISSMLYCSVLTRHTKKTHKYDVDIEVHVYLPLENKQNNYILASSCFLTALHFQTPIQNVLPEMSVLKASGRHVCLSTLYVNKVHREDFK